MTFPKRAEHPRSCQVCHGDGWQPGPPIRSQQAGRPFNYTTVIPCQHHWTNDEPQLDLDEPSHA